MRLHWIGWASNELQRRDDHSRRGTLYPRCLNYDRGAFECRTEALVKRRHRSSCVSGHHRRLGSNYCDDAEPLRVGRLHFCPHLFDERDVRKGELTVPDGERDVVERAKAVVRVNSIKYLNLSSLFISWQVSGSETTFYG